MISREFEVNVSGILWVDGLDLVFVEELGVCRGGTEYERSALVDVAEYSHVDVVKEGVTLE